MKKLVTITWLALVLSLIVGCEDSVQPSHFEYTKLFSGEVSKAWKMKSIAFRNVGDPDWTLTVPCWADEQYIFNRDKEKKFEVKSGNNKCDPDEEPYDIIDTWSYNSAAAALYFVHPLFSESPIPFTVKEVDKNSMTLELYFDDGAIQSFQLKFESISEN